MSRNKRKEEGQEKAAKKKFGIFAKAIAAFVLVIFAAVIAAFLRQNHAQEPKLTIHRFEETQMTEFWAKRLQPVAQQLNERTFPLKEINERYDFLSVKIKSRYNTGLGADVVLGYHPVHPYILAESCLVGGKTCLRIYVAAYCNLYKIWEENGVAQRDEIIRNSLAVSVLHEMDHLAGGWVREKASDKPYTIDDAVESEKRAWAETCQHTLRVMAEYRYKVLGSDWEMYRHWEECGRDAESPAWDSCIRAIYAPVHNRFK